MTKRAGRRLGCIADDYTGASDLASTLSRAGLRTVQTIGLPEGLALPEADALVVAFKCRSIPPSQAIAMAQAARGWLRGWGADHLLYKICSTFDSTGAGNIGPVMDSLRAADGGGIVPVTPAFPELARTVYMGHLFVGTRALDESSMRDHPLNPMRDANLARLLARQSHSSVGLVDLPCVRGGEAAIGDRLDVLAGQGFGAAIIDALCDSDLDSIGSAALRMPLSVGASGLGLGLARALIARGDVVGDGAVSVLPLPSHGSAAALSGSCSQATLAQISQAERSMPVLRLDPERLVEGPEESLHAIDWARARLPDGPLLIASSAPPSQVAALTARVGRAQTAALIETAMAQIALGLVSAGVRRLIVAGGETAGAAVDRLGLRAFAVGPEAAPGVPLLRTIGQPDMLLALKSGNFGGPDFFAATFRLMEEMA